jgi:UTP--glucose-1-phosphate uridylyltransferase
MLDKLNSQHNCPIFAVKAIPKEQVSSHGIIDPVSLKPTNGVVCGRVKAIVEKPDFDQAPSNLGIIGRYILDKDIFTRLYQAQDTIGDKELGLTEYIRPDSMYYKYDGVLFDGGSPKSYD